MVGLSAHPFEINPVAAALMHDDRGSALQATLEVEPADKLLSLAKARPCDRPHADRALWL
ncbi:MAG TPA: hypothetical protein VF043_09375 [Ktedonobacteraceae bacterium]